MVEQPECNEGMAPKMSGEFVKPVVYMSKPSNRSILPKPPGEPFME